MHVRVAADPRRVAAGRDAGADEQRPDPHSQVWWFYNVIRYSDNYLGCYHELSNYQGVGC